jgi:hypothetical protein
MLCFPDKHQIANNSIEMDDYYLFVFVSKSSGELYSVTS